MIALTPPTSNHIDDKCVEKLESCRAVLDIIDLEISPLKRFRQGAVALKIKRAIN